MSEEKKPKRPFISVRERAPDIAAEWDIESNNGMTPDNVSYGSNKEVVWRCRKCGIHFKARINNRVFNSSGCPYCSGRKILPGVNSLAALYPALAEEWHPERNGRLCADEVAPHSSMIAWWHCEDGHSWPAVIADRVNTGSRCPICHGLKRLTRLI